MTPRPVLPQICDRAQIIVLSNREPYSHEFAADGSIQVRHSTSGLVHAVEPLLAACGGVWVAHGSGNADRRVVDEFDRVNVPADDPQYRLRRVWFTDAEYAEYYYGFANDALWPLCHRAFVKPVFRAADLDAYWAANERFADAVCEEAADDAPVVLVQDYHFAFVPAMLRQQLPLSTIVTFWHVPWPEAQRFSICPWGAQLLDGLLGSSIVGFQTDSDRLHFAAAVRETLDCEVASDASAVTYNGRQVALRVYPASIAWTPETDDRVPVSECRQSVRDALSLNNDVRIAVGVDRLDYTKGIEEKFLAVEQLLELYPQYRRKFVLIQLAEPSRPGLTPYIELRARVRAAAERVNRTFGNGDYCPIILLEGHHSQAEVSRFLRAADLCLVGSLHDGMNLVGKEFVRARTDERGVLLLSIFAGASRSLDDALPINPFDPQGTADSIVRGLVMPEAEQRSRMRELRRTVAAADAHAWAAAMLADAARVRSGQTMMPLRTAYSTTSAVL
ncbi:MAG TPA: trehalose-6-phosphate synthase [Vicinamibacterales bacterium]|nr:trehalose-6-phosphate synthase [Vicinamibacterales bacterium]